MDEEREKQLARRFGELMDGARPGPVEEPELSEAMATAEMILAAHGEGPELNPVFDATLRARLVRETKRRRIAHRDSIRRYYALRLAAAAVILFFAPVFLVLRDFQYKNKVELVEKYDRMYVPFSQQLTQADYLGRKLAPFSGKKTYEQRRISAGIYRARAALYMNNYMSERERRSRR